MTMALPIQTKSAELDSDESKARMRTCLETAPRGVSSEVRRAFIRNCLGVSKPAKNPDGASDRHGEQPQKTSPDHQRGESASASGATQRTLKDGLNAEQCLSTTHLKKGYNVADVIVKNGCSFTVQVTSTCLGGNKQVMPDYPFPGVVSFTDGGTFAIKGEGSEPDPAADVCEKAGGKMRYVACQEGTPYFAAVNASKGRCVKD
jgi:hypothetical protein